MPNSTGIQKQTDLPVENVLVKKVVRMLEDLHSDDELRKYWAKKQLARVKRSKPEELALAEIIFGCRSLSGWRDTKICRQAELFVSDREKTINILLQRISKAIEDLNSPELLRMLNAADYLSRVEKHQPELLNQVQTPTNKAEIAAAIDLSRWNKSQSIYRAEEEELLDGSSAPVVGTWSPLPPYKVRSRRPEPNPNAIRLAEAKRLTRSEIDSIRKKNVEIYARLRELSQERISGNKNNDEDPTQG